MFVKQAANVLELLEYFARRKRPATLSELADDLSWPRSSAFNIIGTLIEKGYLYEPRARGGYYPSPRWLVLSQAVADAEPLPEAAYALVAEVAEETGETTAIGAPAGTSTIFIHVVESKAPIRYFAQVGHKLPIHATSTGRAILSQYSREERYALYRKIKFVKHARNTLTSIDEVEAEIRRSQQRGWFQSVSDYSQDLCGVALPVPIQQRRLAMVVAGPEFRCLNRMDQIADIARRAISRFQELLGGDEPEI
jgi:DNA-binding IclR family transcriptional regulator